MSLVNKFHSGLLNAHTDILLQICNKIDEQGQTYNKIDKIDKIPNVLLEQQLEDRLNTLEKLGTDMNDKIESILTRLNNIESNNKNNNIVTGDGCDITSFIERLKTLESNVGSNVESSTGTCIGYSPYVCDKPAERFRPNLIKVECKKTEINENILDSQWMDDIAALGKKMIAKSITDQHNTVE
jgi:hypothetical protein